MRAAIAERPLRKHGRRGRGIWGKEEKKKNRRAVKADAYALVDSQWLAQLPAYGEMTATALCAGMSVFFRVGWVPVCRFTHTIARLAGISSATWSESSLHEIALRSTMPAVYLFAFLCFLFATESACAQTGLFLSEVHQFTRPAAKLALIAVLAQLLLIVQARALESVATRSQMPGRQELLLRLDGIRKLLTFATFSLAGIAALRVLGVQIFTLLSVGGISGLAIGLAGRQILENVFSAFALYLTAPFIPGEDIIFSQSSGLAGVEGTVLDIGLLRTLVRNYDKDLYSVPNVSVANASVLNITRRPTEFQVFDRVHLLSVDVERVYDAMLTFRRMLKQDDRVPNDQIQRVYVDNIAADGTMSVILRFYCIAGNRTTYWHMRSDFLLDFATTCLQHGVRLARPTRSFDAPLHQTPGEDDSKSMYGWVEQVSEQKEASSRS